MTAPLPRYLAAAFLARLADEGVGVTVALLAVERTGSAGLGALVLTSFTAPHLLAGPLAGALAAKTRSPRLLHTGALTGFAAALATLPALVGRAPVWAVVAANPWKQGLWAGAVAFRRAWSGEGGIRTPEAPFGT